jgi:hypothetical protein
VLATIRFLIVVESADFGSAGHDSVLDRGGERRLRQCRPRFGS